jgi:CheY-like chemotaxis protein
LNQNFDLLGIQLSVLLVDDNKVNQFLGKKILSNLGVKKIELASSAAEALQKLDADHFDLMLTDVEMPGMNGYELSQSIRSRETGKEHLIIIALTANATSEDRELAKAAGIDDYLTKPYSPQDLFEVLSRHAGFLHNSLEDINTINTDVQNYRPFQVLYDSFRNNKADVRQFLFMLSQQMPGLVSEIKRGILENNIDLAYHNAHKLKSPVKLLGNPEFVARYAEFTEQLRHTKVGFNAASELEQLLPDLESLLVMVNSELEKE